MNRLKRIWEKVFPSKFDREKHNLNVSANVGRFIIDKLYRDRSFRRCLDLKFPELTKDIDEQIKQIK